MIRYKFIPDEGTSFSILKAKKLDIDGLTPLQIDRQLPKDFYQNFTIHENKALLTPILDLTLKIKNGKIKDYEKL